jgi:uncharacterized membrane protein YgcG
VAVTEALAAAAAAATEVVVRYTFKHDTFKSYTFECYSTDNVEHVLLQRYSCIIQSVTSIESTAVACTNQQLYMCLCCKYRYCYTGGGRGGGSSYGRSDRGGGGGYGAR